LASFGSDRKFLKRAGNREAATERGAFSFGYFSLGMQRKVTRLGRAKQETKIHCQIKLKKQNFKVTGFSPSQE
jgi:hypothetical protein